MKTNKFVDFIVKNRYVILGVSIVVILSLTGVIKALLELSVTIFLIIVAIYIGRRVQEDDSYIKKMFNNTKNYKYDYKVEDDDQEKKE